MHQSKQRPESSFPSKKPDDFCDTSIYVEPDSDTHKRPRLTALQAEKDCALAAGLGHWAMQAKMYPLTKKKKNEAGAVSASSMVNKLVKINKPVCIDQYNYKLYYIKLLN